jgi:multicomponent Na+:H+ antiporter subunit C
MTTATFYGFIGIAVFALALYHVIVGRELLRRILALNVLGSGLFVALIALAYRGPDVAPDPVPQALVLTGIVVAISATGLALALYRRLRAATDRPDET